MIIDTPIGIKSTDVPPTPERQLSMARRKVNEFDGGRSLVTL